MKIVELQKLFNFVVNNFLFEFIYGKKSNLHLVGCNMWTTKLPIGHKACHRRSGSGGYARG
jgi:hypothetical protein